MLLESLELQIFHDFVSEVRLIVMHVFIKVEESN
jgi:hypothetical protein